MKQRSNNRLLLVTIFFTLCWTLLFGTTTSAANIKLATTATTRQGELSLTLRHVLGDKKQRIKFVAQSRIDDTQTGEGIIEIDATKNYYELKFVDHKREMTHMMSTKENVHIIKYHATSLQETIKAAAKHMNKQKTVENDQVLCQPYHRGKSTMVDAKLEYIEEGSFDKDINKCQSAWATTIEGRRAVLCSSQPTGVTMGTLEKIIFDAMIVQIVKEKDEETEIVPRTYAKQCAVGALQRSIFKLLAKEQGKDQEESTTTAWYKEPTTCESDFADETTCAKLQLAGATEQGPTCVFLHGVGQDSTEPSSDTFTDYWGDVNKYTKHCGKHIFVKQDTRRRGWDNISLQEAYCDAMLTGNAPGDRVVRNKILYVHSMGNLIVAGALRNNICQLDESSRWYDVMGPLLGSRAAELIEEVCAGKDTELYRTIAKLGGYCVPGKNTSFPAYKTLRRDYPGIEGLADIARQYTKGTMCGISSFGLYTPYSVLYLLSKIVKFGRENDGMVPIDSCGLGAAFKEDYTAANYATASNHADGTCRSGDGWWRRDRSPCSWYSERK